MLSVQDSSLAEGAFRQAEAEGLTLQPSDSTTGFKGVTFGSSKSKPYQAQVSRRGKHVHLGTFAIAEEAALCYARDIAVNGAPALTGVYAVAAAPAPLTAEEALRQAEAEGLTLQPSDSTTGFKGVVFDSSRSKPYQAKMWRGGKHVHLGTFATAEEAALCYAHDIAANGAPALSTAAKAAIAPAPLTAEEALRQAEAEGLALQPTDSPTGFKGVVFGSSKFKPYQAQVRRGGKHVHLGTFATAEEAALCYARYVAANGSPALNTSAVSNVAAEAAPEPLTAEEALRQAETEGLALQPSDSTTGFKGVVFGSSKSKPYQAQVRRGGKHVHLGTFAIAEEAALCYARDLAANGSPALNTSALSNLAAEAAPAPLTAEEALRQAEAEGLMLLLSDNTAGFKGVGFVSGRSKSKPYQAQVRRGGKHVHLGTFAIAEEAALCYARDLAANGLSAAAAAKAVRDPASWPRPVDGNVSELAQRPMAQASPGAMINTVALLGRPSPAVSSPLSAQGGARVRAGLIGRPNLIADLCKIIERQSSQIAELRACMASQPSAGASHSIVPQSMASEAPAQVPLTAEDIAHDAAAANRHSDVEQTPLAPGVLRRALPLDAPHAKRRKVGPRGAS